MLKVLVFDGGCGGNIVADFLETQLSTIEIECAIDWDHAPYDERALPEVLRLTAHFLKDYIGKVDLIILGGYTVARALNYLRDKYPQQKFVGVDINYHLILKGSTYPERITVMMNQSLINTDFCKEIRNSLPFSTLTIPDCSGWENLANYGNLSKTTLRRELEGNFILQPDVLPINLEGKTNPARNKPILEMILEQKRLKAEAKDNPPKPEPDQELESVPNDLEEIPLVQHQLVRSDVVLLLNTNFWEAKENLESLFGYQVRILDFRNKLLHDTCAALGLLGVHGERSQ